MQKVAVVTGSAKGLGRSIALALSKEGYTLVIHYHKSKTDARKVLREIRQISGDSISFGCDLRSSEGALDLAKEVFSKFGRIDLLVNNVGNFAYKHFSQTSNTEFCDVLESNVYSTLFTSRAFLPAMRKQKSGNIINIGAVGCERVQLTEKSSTYFFAKTGVYVITKAMAREEARNGVRINMISPGSLATDIFQASDFPMGRSAKYNDVISALMFLISPEAQYINGANIEVAGAFIPG